MKTVKLMEPFRFEILEQDIPQPGSDEVLLKNAYLGVCTSDVQIYHGKHAYAAMPVVMGHEESGVIAAVGSHVTDWKVGDRVVLQPQLFCRECYPCRSGHLNVCENLKVIGVHTDGCACEYTVVPAWNLHRVPDNVSFRIAALAEPMAVAFGAVRRLKEVTDIRGKKICVVGAGTIGNLVAQVCKINGAAATMVTDLLPEKLELARKCGIDYAVNTKEMPLAEAIEECFGADKADVIVDFVAQPAVFNTILKAARNASVIMITGNYKEPVSYDMTLLQRREISLVGHMMYIREEFDDALQAMSDGSICTDGLVTQEWTLDQYAGAFRYFDEQPENIVKMVVKIAEDL